MNNNETFKLLSKTEMTIDYITKELLNYPKYEVVLRNKIESVMYDMIYQIYSYRITQNKRIKSKNLNDLIIYLSMLDYYMRISYNKKIINSHKYNEIKKITYGVLNYEESSL